ncbi:Fe(3+) dicitrate transport protein FecA precursor [Ferrovum myxofaciens]|uniref:Fe(3+) dicitrate transport protein FecA n=1 Tax=Ferrovum myxofaciens TaxID=416213 RepID=A0A149VVH9_9PROT|nr:TonB-dependent receptor [Ferrovum myxofaciens]KXW57227.1 Fe(3+) dicitrate transport protein FecA precursor [Ferrovum myxofaciens]
MYKKKFRLRPLISGLFHASMLTALPGTLWAYDLGSVSSGAGNSNEAIPPAESASANAPTQGSLTATEPQSVINRNYIENTQTGASTYVDNAAIAPGVWSVSPNGPGGSDQGGLVMRSFQDGQYNVTFDGIPFADGADFTHHVNTYFLGQDTGEVTVDRGPGRASTVGDSTYGGTIALRSNDPQGDPAATVRSQVGSFNSRLVGFQYDTGVMQNYGDASGFIDYNHYQTDGALTNGNERRGNVFAKFIKPLNEDTAITVVAMQNNTFQNASPGATAQQISKYGSNYGLNQNPLSTGYVGYNNDQFTSNFDYIGLQTRFGDWKIDNKVYTTSYAHNAMNGNNPNGTSGQTLAGAGNGLLLSGGNIAQGSNIAGVTGLTAYTSYGDILRATRALGNDDLNFGLWIERQLHQSWTNNVDLSTGGLGSIINQAGVANGGNQAETSSMNTIQPYVEYIWRPTSKWSITPGLKFNDFSRTYNAAYDTSVQGAFAYSHTWASLLPSLDAHYYVTDNWSAYGQAAAGMQAPMLFGSFYNPNQNQALSQAAQASYLAPEKTMNYQLGTVFKSSKLTASADVYYITNNNLSQASATGGLITIQNVGAVHYQGVEGEATYNLGSGFNAYGNYSLNSYTSAIPIQNAPQSTAALGMLYEHNKTNASLIAKEIGSRWGGTDVNGNYVHFGSYTTVNLATGYNFGSLGWAKDAKLEFQLDDLFNRTDMIAYAGQTQGNNALYWTLPGRMFSLNLSAGF